MSKLAVLVVLVSSVAFAQKYTRQPRVTVPVTVSERSKPPPAKVAPPAAAAPAEAVYAVEIAAGPVRQEMEAILKKLIASTPDTAIDEKADLYFRLGELYAKQQRVARLQAAEAAIKGDRAKATAASDEAQAHMLDAVRAYQALTNNDAFRNWPKMDMALFYYGYTLQSGKYMKEARAVMDKLLRNYPASKYVADAHLIFADYFYEQRQLGDAEARYKQVLAFPKSPAYWYAMYKLGWVQLDRGRHDQALETFYQVAQGTKRDAARDVLHRAAEKDFVREYAEVGKTDKAYDAFRRVDAARGLEMLALLADFYLQQGKSDKGIYTYRELMRLAPGDKSACAWQHDIAQLTLSLPGAAMTDRVSEIERLARLWTAIGSKLPKAEAQECREDAAAMSGELARAYHSEAVKTQNVAMFGYAERLYRAYLAAFPAAPDHAQTRYFYAELLWSLATATNKPAQWERAADAFTAAIETRKLDPSATKEAAYACVLAWMKALDLAVKPPVVDEPIAEQVPAPKPIPAREQQLIAAFDRYLKYVKNPDDDERIGIQFLEANVYRRYDHFAEAIPIFREILTRHPTHETAEYAANLLLDIYNRQHDEPSLIALADQLLGKHPASDDLAQRLVQIRRTYERRGAERLAREKDFEALNRCGEAFLAIYNRDPLAKDNDEVLYNAGDCFERARSLDAAIRMYNLLERYYPKSRVTARALARLGKVYGDVALYAKAADKLEQYAKRYAGERDAYDALNDAVLYRKGIGDDDKAIEDTKYFVKTFGKTRPTEAANAAFSLIDIYEKRAAARSD